MPPYTYESFLTKDTSSGKVHRRVVEWDQFGGRRMLVDERCNLDQAGGYVAIEESKLGENPNLCGHCFPAQTVTPDPVAMQTGTTPPQ